MKLIDLLVQELPKRGGWPEGYEVVSTNGYGAVWAYKTKGCTAGRELYFHSTTEGHVTREQYEAALAAAQPQWDGDGLPPVGCEFEHSFHADNFSTWHWRRCTATGKHGVLCVDKNDTELYLNDTYNKFRPIRSEAEKKRDVFVDQVMQWMHHAGRAEIELIYDKISTGELLLPNIRIE